MGGGGSTQLKIMGTFLLIKTGECEASLHILRNYTSKAQETLFSILMTGVLNLNCFCRRFAALMGAGIKTETLSGSSEKRCRQTHKGRAFCRHLRD